jgi:hypothetical protein
MKSLAWLVTVFVVVAGVTCILAPGAVLGLQSLFATRSALLGIAIARAAIGVVLIMAAPRSRFPKGLQAAGAIMLLAGMVTPLFGVERTKAVLEWEAAQGPVLIRVIGTAVVALGGALVFALTPKRSF